MTPPQAPFSITAKSVQRIANLCALLVRLIAFAIIYSPSKPSPVCNVVNIITIETKLPVRSYFEKLTKQSCLRHLDKVALIYESHFTGKNSDEIRQLFHDNHAWDKKWGCQHSFPYSSQANQHGATWLLGTASHLSQANSNCKTTQNKKPNSPKTKTWDGNTSATPKHKERKN